MHLGKRFRGSAIGIVAGILIVSSSTLWASTPQDAKHRVSGIIVTSKEEVVKDVSVTARTVTSQQTVVSNENGQFSLEVPNEELTLRVDGPYIKPQEQTVHPNMEARNLRIQIELFIRGGLAILRKIERQNYDVWSRRPKLSKLDKAMMIAKVVGRRWRVGATA